LGMSKATKTIIISGDVTIDWNLARTRRSTNDVAFWSADDTTSTTWQRGGSALLADLVEEIAKNLYQEGAPQFTILQTGAPRKSSKVLPDNDHYHHSYAMWSHFKNGEKLVWRVKEFLGLDRANIDSIQDWQKVSQDTSEAVLVILDDADLGFRDHPELWPVALQNNGQNRPWVLLKMARPLARGLLWEHLYKNFSDRLIVVATVDDLRLSEVQISRELSWERTAQDIYWELIHNPCINSLSHCAHVVISLGPSGAILLSNQEEKKQPSYDCSLFFDPKAIENTWKQDYPGGMVGYTTCLTAGLARQWMIDPKKPNLQTGIQSGLSAMRVLHLDGYAEGDKPESKKNIHFPIGKISAALANPVFRFSVAAIQNPMGYLQKKNNLPAEKQMDGFWTILEDRLKGGLEQVAMQVVLEGPESALQGVPWGQFGNLLTVDRQEIESYRSIRNLIAEYTGQKQVSRPLSIAVFGMPGSGKSFGVTEMAKSLLPGQIETITFNLSQFDSVDDLISAFHQVRDIGLSGKIPLVFWDEFDTTMGDSSLGWLRYFLAPMQDGKFQEGQINHPIGRAIFVFAGGTSTRMAEFTARGAEAGFKLAKGPDFISRLKGFINVLGPNPINGKSKDPFFILRRAILLRSSLRRNTSQLFEKRGGIELLNIDRGVLRALLEIGQYKHGARSIESLFAMSQLSGKTVFERSCLPPEFQLDLHVDGKSFLSLVQQVELEGQILECLAEATHYIFCEGLKARGFSYGPKTDEKLKTNTSLLPYAELPEYLKEQNRLNVRDIPGKLELAGYIMTPERSNRPLFNFPGEPLEILAEVEHIRWMQSKLNAGWRYASQTDNAKKLNKCLVPWKKLPEEEKAKDRDLVRGIPQILAHAGFAVEKTGQ
ncbi:MAG: RyR domain-containing protein, partial [Anaerolineaceae bacterium]|nr:RyR domain-containing protein [Anaerolineaceae bacterium]